MERHGIDEERQAWIDILESGNPEEVFFSRPEISFKMAVAALTVLVVSGIFAGLIPAKRAVSIKPIDALRDEGI